MRKAFVISAIAMISATNLHAQVTEENHPVDNAWVALNTAMLNIELKLNDEQRIAVKEIDQRYVKKHQVLEATTPKLSDNEMAKKTEGLMDERDAALKAVLNAEQYASWKKMRHKGTNHLNDEQKDKMEKEKRD